MDGSNKRSIHDIEIEYDDNEDVEMAFYNGKPYSGIAYEQSNKVYSEKLYIAGKLASEKCWNVDHVLIYEEYEDYFKSYYDTGILKEYNSEQKVQRFYSTGVLKLEYDGYKKMKVAYWNDGTWLYKQQANKYGAMLFKKELYEFNDVFLQNNYMQMLEKEFGLIEKELLFWIESCDCDKKNEIVCNMIASENLCIKYKGICFAEKFKIWNAMKYLEKEKSNQQIPPGIHGRTISLAARQAIGTIKLDKGISMIF